MVILKCAAMISRLCHGGSRVAMKIPMSLVGYVAPKLPFSRLQEPRHAVSAGLTAVACAATATSSSYPLLSLMSWFPEAVLFAGSACTVHAAAAWPIVAGGVAAVRHVKGGRQYGVVAAVTSSRMAKWVCMGMLAIGLFMRQVMRPGRIVCMPGIGLKAGPPVSGLSMSMFAVTAPCTSRIVPSPRQPGGGAGVCYGSTSETVRGVFDAACEGLCRCASLVLIFALLVSGVDGASCAPAFQADMPNDSTTLVGWVVGDVPVVGGVPTPGWQLKVIMEDQCRVAVVDQPGCGMVRGGQSRVNKSCS